MSTATPSAPPPSYDQRWMYWFWAWSQQRIIAAGTTPFSLAGDVSGTSTTGTLTAALGTTGVGTGTYGNSTAVGQFVVDAKGRVLSATNVTITATGGGTGGGFNPWILTADVLGTATTGTLTAALSTTGVTAGTYGTGGTMVPQVVVDAKGRLTSVSNVGIVFPAGTGGGFTVMTGDVLGTAVGGTMVAQVGTIAGPFRVGTGTVNSIFDPTEVNGIMLNIINATGANGANIKIRGTGATPSKFLRAANNRFDILNNAYSLTLWSVDDGGTSTAIMAQAGTSSAGLMQAGTATAVLAQATSASVVGTGTFGGVVSTGALQGAAGSSATRGNAVISPYLDAVPVSRTLGGPGTFMSYNIPAGALAGSGQGFRFTAWGSSDFGNAVGGLVVKLGTATIGVSTATAANVNWSVDGIVAVQASNQQTYYSRFDAFGAVTLSQVSGGTLGMNLSTATPLFLVGTSTNSNARTQRGMAVEFIGFQ